MLKSFRYLRPYLWTIILIFTLVIIRALMNLVLPLFVGNLIDDMTSTVLSEQEKYTSLLINVGLMLASTVIGIGVIIWSGYLESKTSSLYAKSLREALYQKVQTFSMVEMDKFTTSSLITRSTNDIQTLQGTINMLLRMAVMSPFMAIGAITMAIAKHPTISTILVFSIIMVVGTLALLWKVAMPKFRIIQRLVDHMNLVVRENLSGLRVVRAFNTQKVQIEKTQKVAYDSMQKNIFVNRIFSAMWPVMGLVMQLTTVGIYFIAIEFNFISPLSDLTPGDLSAMVQYATSTIMNFMMITMILTMIPRASISANRVMDVIDAELSIENPQVPFKLEHIEGEITFNKVTFQYPGSDEPVLKNIDFTIKPNQTTAFIGSTGSGKSTLINLVPRFYDPTEGSILVDGVDIRTLNQEAYLKYIGYVPQKGNLFKGTIQSNIAFGQTEVDEAVVKKSAEIAQAKDFIEKLDEAYDAPITQGGTNVSGGQRQRLSIARALAKEPKIYIFDDSFSALDYRTDTKLRQALSKHVNATVLIVAQRINTIRHADQIVVLDKGEIVGIGTHDELMQSCQVYIEIAESQLSKEELRR